MTKMNKIIKIIFCLMCLLCLPFSFIQKHSYAYAESSAKAMVVIESNSKRVLYGKNVNLKLAL